MCPGDLCCSFAGLSSLFCKFHDRANPPLVHPSTRTQLRHPPRSLRFICAGIIFHPVGDVWCETRYPPVQGQEQKRQRHAGQEASAVNWAMLAPAALPSARPSELPWVPKSSYAEAAVTTEYHDLSCATPCQGLAPSWGRTKNILFIGGGVLGGLHGKMHVN